jgi:hypothetical protein
MSYTGVILTLAEACPHLASLHESATPATRQTSGGPVIPRKGNDTMIVPNPSTPEASR